MAKKITIEVTEAQFNALWGSVERAIELDETFYEDGCKRDAEAAGYYRTLKKLIEKFETMQNASVGVNPFTNEKVFNGGINPFTGEKVGA